MAVLEEDFGTDLTLVEGNGGIRSCPVSVPERTPRDLRSLYERERARADRERARADAAEARAEELRWAEVASRSDAGAWKSRFKACRGRLSEAVEETKEARRAARGRAFLAGRSGAPGDAPLRSRHRVEREQQDRPGYLTRPFCIAGFAIYWAGLSGGVSRLCFLLVQSGQGRVAGFGKGLAS